MFFIFFWFIHTFRSFYLSALVYSCVCIFWFYSDCCSIGEKEGGKVQIFRKIKSKTTFWFFSAYLSKFVSEEKYTSSFSLNELRFLVFPSYCSGWLVVRGSSFEISLLSILFFFKETFCLCAGARTHSHGKALLFKSGVSYKKIRSLRTV